MNDEAAARGKVRNLLTDLSVATRPEYFGAGVVRKDLEEIAALGGDPKDLYDRMVQMHRTDPDFEARGGFNYPTFEALMAYRNPLLSGSTTAPTDL